ncbi:complex I assembly factor TIMMDC1, mitochondrial-like isoform X1 [Physella acuta]|uniref:complex I assembly factor TIMMDC1, mitochondrial-like isoform X1 n=1 Tax=Physella acuta TaxID=109671 RepID=UPI0027DBE76D|nr:complex I assembly factor TIMMDC1, mitochondrial-like isoform X1 [Physella acuta]
MNRILDLEMQCKRTHSPFYPFLNTQCTLFPACKQPDCTSSSSPFRNFKTFIDLKSNSTFLSSLLPTACCSSKSENSNSYSNESIDKNKADMLPCSLDKNKEDMVPCKIDKNKADLLPGSLDKNKGDMLPCSLDKNKGEMPCSLEKNKGDMLPGSLAPPSGKQMSYSNEINKWLEKETGFDRLKIMFAFNETGFLQPDVQEMNTMLRRSIFLGIIYGAISATLEVNKRKAEKSASKSEAVLKGITKEVLGRNYIIKETMKTTLQIATLSLSFIHLSQAIAAYRNESTVWEYTISTAVGLGLINLGRPLKTVLSSTATGAVIGTVGGYVACYVLSNAGLNQEQRHRERILSFLTNEKPMHKSSV